MRVGFERTAILLALVASPFWLPSFPARLGSSMRSALTEWLRGPLGAFQTAREGWTHLGSGLLEWMWIHEENQLLRSRLETLKAHEQTHLDLFLENARFRRLLEFKERSAWVTIPAEVIGRELGPGSRTLLLDKGSADGLHSGMAVVAPSGLVGRVGDVGPTSCRVLLMTDPHFRVAAVLLTRRIPGLVTGGGVGESLMTYLPIDLDPVEGETVLTSGGRSFCPEGIPVGAVRKVWTDRSQLFKTATLQPVVDLQTVEEVLVVAWQPSASARSS